MSNLYEAVDCWGRELKEGDTVITQGRLAQFSHCTEKRMMVRIPSVVTIYDGYQLIQRRRHDVQKFVPELEDDFLKRMEEAKSDSAHYKKRVEERKKAHQAEMEKLKNEQSN